MLDEDYWYGMGWRRLRGALVSLAVREAKTTLLLELDRPGDLEPRVSAYLERLTRAASKLQRPDNPQWMWNFAMSLLAHPELLLKRVRGDLEALRGKKDGVLPAGAFGRLMGLYLTDSRLQVAMSTDERHVDKVWSRIRHVSDEVASEATKTGRPLREGERCETAHIHEVFKRLRARFPDDHNLPRKLELCEDFFGRFCEDCLALSSADVADIIDMTDFYPPLDACLKALAERDAVLAEALAAKFGIAIGTVSYLNASAYQQTKGLTRGRFEQLADEGFRLVSICVERSVAGYMDKAVRR